MGLLELKDPNYGLKFSFKEETSIPKDAAKPHTRQLKKNTNELQPKKRFNCIIKKCMFNFTKWSSLLKHIQDIVKAELPSTAYIIYLYWLKIESCESCRKNFKPLKLLNQYYKKQHPDL